MNRRRFLATGLSASSVAVAGCVSIPGTTDTDEPAPSDDPPSSADLIADALETTTSVETVAARRTMRIETPDSSIERVGEIATRTPTHRRLEVVESTDGTVPAGSVSVRTPTVSWEYDPDEELAVERHHPNRFLVDERRLDLEVLLEDDSELAYDGVESVDGRDAHVVGVEPAIDEDELERSLDLLVGETVYRIPLELPADEDDLEDPTVERRLWIDDESRYPVKERAAVSDGDELRNELSVTYEDLSLEEGLPEETFEYEPPEGVPVETTGTEPEGIYDSRADADAVAPYDLPDPAVPDPYDLDRIVVLEKRAELGTSTTFWYRDPDEPDRELFVAVRDEKRFSPDVLEKTDLEFDGNTVYHRDGRIQSLFWNCGTLNYELSSPETAAPLEAVAPSVGCPSQHG